MKKLNVEQMTTTYRNALNHSDAENIWNTFRKMYEMDFISWYTWSKFFDANHDYEFNFNF